MEGSTDILLERARQHVGEAWRWVRNAGSVAWPKLRRLVRGPFLGVVFTLLFCFGVLGAATRASDRFYAGHLVAADSSYSLMNAAVVVSGKQDFALQRLLRNPAPFRASDGGTEIYVLHNFVAWFLRHVLPLRPAMAVMLNGVWFVAMALSLYTLFWSRIGRWSTAALATAAYLVANPYLATIYYGLTSADPNIVGFMLGTSALSCVVLSDRFQRTLPCLFAGLFLGLLVLGRAYTLGVVLPAIFPYVVASFWRRSRAEMLQSLSGGLFTIAIMSLVSTWWLKGHWRLLLAYPTQYGSQGILSKITLMDSLLQWCHFPKQVLGVHLFLICVLSWPFAVGLLAEKRSFKDLNWPALWAALIPLFVLSKLGTTFEPYGTVALLGAFVLLLFPFSHDAYSFVRHRGFAAALAIATALAVWSFFGELDSAHASTSNSKRGTIAALETMKSHAKDAKRRRVTLGLVHWGTLHDAALVDALIFDAGVRVAAPGFNPRRRPNMPLVVTPLVLDPWAWDESVHGKDAVTPEAWVQRISDEADYVLVLAGSRNPHRRRERWAAWVAASAQLRASRLFQPLGPPFSVPGDGPLQLLVRRDFPPDRR